MGLDPGQDPGEAEAGRLALTGLETVRARHSHAFYKNGNIIKGQAPRALLAYLYFRDKIDHYAAWGSDNQDEDDLDVSRLAVVMTKNDPEAGTRLQALADALLIRLIKPVPTVI